MKNLKKLRLTLCLFCLIAICAIGIFSLTACGEECTEHDFRIDPITASCEDGGLVARCCNKCGFYEEIISEPLGHAYGEWSVSLESNCKTVGEKIRFCVRCHTPETETIDKLPHTVESWSISKKPTASEDGSAYGICVKNCGESVTVTLPALNETDYTTEIVDSESKIYTYTFENHKIEMFVSKYFFISTTLSDNSIGYEIGASEPITTEKLVLPSTYNGYPIVGICKDGFREQDGILEVVIPEGVKFIRAGAFGTCDNLQKVTLPSTVEVIAKDYYGSNSQSFGYVKDIYYNGTAETWCNIRFGSGFYSDNIYFKNQNNEYEQPTEITIPNNVTAIGDYQFYGLTTLKTVNAHANITSIGESAFASSGITSFTMPDSVSSVGPRAFSYCESLATIKLSENIDTIKYYTFDNCVSLTGITIPSKVKIIQYNAFDGCEKLSEVKFMADSLLENIGSAAFDGCSMLTSLVVPTTVNTVGRNALPYSCKTIYYSGNENGFEYINGKNYLKFSDSTVYYYSERLPMSTEKTYWHFDTDNKPALWVFGTTVNGKKYVYSYTETTVTDAYFGMLKAAEMQNMLEMLFPASELGEVLAQRHIDMVKSSSTKAEYEQKLCEFSAEAGQNSSYSFENGKVTMIINGQTPIYLDYVEYENVIYVANGSVLCYIDAENDCIFEKNETEYNTAWHYYEEISES